MRLDELLSRALATAGDEGRDLLPEEVGLAAAREIGLAVPYSIAVAGPEAAAAVDLSRFPSDQLVVKVRSSAAAHRSDIGGVALCRRDPSAIAQVLAEMTRQVGERAVVEGFSLHEFVPHEKAPGDELLLGVRWTDDFGPVAVLGLGGLDVERLARDGPLAPLLIADDDRLPASDPLVDFLTQPSRGRPPRWQRSVLEDLVRRILDFAAVWTDPARPHRVADFEINPLVSTAEGPVALDALLRRASRRPSLAGPRPVDQLRHLLEPSSIAVAGVSKRLNIGRIILQNISHQGFPRHRLWVVKPGEESIDGCATYDRFADLPEVVDLAVLAVAAEQLPDLVAEIVREHRARSLILIPGGVGEREGSEKVATAIEAVIERARAEGGGPLVNGGNCLGVRSVPGRYDAFFIPQHKLAFVGKPAPLAFLSQSGAFAAARASQMATIEPRYLITFGNQIDLTIGDYLTYLERDPQVSVFACYLEGFRPLDGRAFLRSVHRLARSGRALVLYRAGRTVAGARAAASHTASVAGSYRVTRELALRAGALVADSIEEFEDLTRLFCLLERRRPAGPRLGAMSNAGFETVAIGDRLADLELARLGPATETKLAEIFRRRHLEAIVAPRNPLDVTPVSDDEAFVEAARLVLEDDGVDLGLIGCVPLTGALQTLPVASGHRENLAAAESVAERLSALWRNSTKPWIAVVDAGRLYDPLARRLEDGGIPTFRSIDRALRALATWARFWRRFDSFAPRPSG